MTSTQRYKKIKDPIVAIFIRRLGWSETSVVLFFVGLSALIFLGLGGVASSTYVGAGRKILSLDNLGFLIVWMLVFLPILFGMYLWQIRAIDQLMESLIRNDIFRKDAKEEIRNQQDKIFLSMSDKWIYISAIIFMVIFWLYQILVGWPQQFEHVRQFWYDVAWYLPFHIFGWIIGLYALYILVIRQTLIALSIAKIMEKADLSLEILDPDSAGGLGEIGEFIKTSSMYAIGLGVVAALYAVEVYLSSAQILERVDVIGFFIVYLVFMPLCLISPWRNTSKAMLKARSKVLEPISLEFQETLQSAQTKIADVSTEEIKAINERLDQLQKHRAIILNNFPTTPIPDSTLRKFSISASLPILSGITSILLQIFGR